MKPNKFIKITGKKKKKKYFFKYIVGEIIHHKILALIGFILLLVTAIIIWTATATNKVTIVGGSTSVAQVMKNITEQYKRDNKKDILYNSLGSAASLVGVKNGNYAFGLLSKDINSTFKPGDNQNNAQQLWSDYHTSRFVFARDYIILVYHLPIGCEIISEQNSLNFKNFYNGEKTNLIQQIYTNKNFTWQQAFASQLVCERNNNKFYTVTRESGSGTLDFFESTIIKNKNYKINQVAPSNGAMYQIISTTPCSIGYISFSYIKTIIMNENLGIKSIAGIIEKDSEKPKLPYKIVNNKYKFNPEYPLTRPFTGIINYKSKQFNENLAFIAWMLDPLPYSKTKPKLRNGKDNPYFDKNFVLNPHYAAYWYIEEGEEPLSFDDIFFKKYNNNTIFAKSGKITFDEKIPWNFKSNYKSIWDIIVEKFPKKYKKYNNYNYNGMEN